MNTHRSDPELPPIRVSYFQRVRNIGDAVAPALLESVAGRPAMSARSTDLPYVVSIGSIIQNSTPQSFIWGTGLIHPDAGVGRPDPRRVLAVRGKLTYAELLRNGIHVGDVPLGDPGILIPRLLRPQESVAPRFSLGLVPHVFDRVHPFFVEAANDPSVKVLDVCSPAEVFFAEMAACRSIASSSLHGLVFGEALGLPTLYLVVSENFVGGEFKFTDWFSLAKNPQRKPVRPRSFVSAAEIAAQCEPRQVEIDTGALMGALTPDVIEACSRTSQPKTMIPVAACRARPLPIFILSYNNAANLQRMICSCRRQNRVLEIAIYDDGSDESDTLALLDRLESDGIWIHRRGGEDPAELWQRVNNAVLAFFRDWSEPSRYAVTRCEVDFSTVGTAALDLYDDLLDRFPRADSVGPSIADLPSDQAGVETAVNGKALPAAESAPGSAAIVPWRCIVIDGGFDLGFAVYRAGKPLLATMKSLRVCDPH